MFYWYCHLTGTCTTVEASIARTDRHVTGSDITVEAYTGATVTFKCDIDVDYPHWVHPKIWEVFSLDTNSIHSKPESMETERLLYDNNKRDLILIDVTPDDDGPYECVFNGTTGSRITLVVKGNRDTLCS